MIMITVVRTLKKTSFIGFALLLLGAWPQTAHAWFFEPPKPGFAKGALIAMGVIPPVPTRTQLMAEALLTPTNIAATAGLMYALKYRSISSKYSDIKQHYKAITDLWENRQKPTSSSVLRAKGAQSFPLEVIQAIREVNNQDESDLQLTDVAAFAKQLGYDKSISWFSLITKANQTSSLYDNIDKLEKTLNKVYNYLTDRNNKQTLQAAAQEYQDIQKRLASTHQAGHYNLQQRYDYQLPRLPAPEQQPLLMYQQQTPQSQPVIPYHQAPYQQQQEPSVVGAPARGASREEASQPTWYDWGRGKIVNYLLGTSNTQQQRPASRSEAPIVD